MKNFLYVFLLLLALVACTEGGVDDNNLQPEAKIPINISTSITRANDTTFESGDKVGIYVVNQPNSLVSAGNHADNIGFTYSDKWTPDEVIYWKDQTTKADFYAYYPYSATANTSAHSFAVKEDQSAEADYWASDFLWGKTTNVSPTEAPIPIKVKHLFSNMHIYLEAGDGLTDDMLATADITVKIKGVKTKASIDLASGVAIAVGEATTIIPWNTGDYYRALIAPQTVAEGVLVEVTVDGINYTFTKGFTFETNKQYDFTIILNKVGSGVKIDISEWENSAEDYGGSGYENDGIDLSQYTDLSAEGTANCYLVKGAGNYKFKAVKGNSDDTVGDTQSAEVLWESFGTDVMPNVGDLIASVGFKNGYIYFSTPEAFGNGNASIAVRNSEDKILWSWHIWCSEEGWNDHVYPNNAGIMMDRNLGATSATPGDVGAFGLLYQWGRKDPFLGSGATSGTTLAASTGSWNSTYAPYGELRNFATENPMTIIGPAWSGISLVSCWRSSESDKGIDDPCPVGYRVPDGGKNSFWITALDTSIEEDIIKWDSINRGSYWVFLDGETTAWYPAAGWASKGILKPTEVGLYGYFWTGSGYPTSYSAYFAYLGESTVKNLAQANNMSFDYALSVRCVRE